MFTAVRNYNLYANFYRKSLEISATFKLTRDTLYYKQVFENQSNNLKLTGLFACVIILTHRCFCC